MADEPDINDPYVAVLADLKAKREEIDRAIAVIEGIRGIGISTAGEVPGATGTPRADNSIPSGAFHGLSIADAAKKLLSIRNRDMNNADIVSDLRAGGLILTSSNPGNTTGSVLTRRFQQVGDIVRVGRGTWGLAEWHPTIRYKPRNNEKSDNNGDKQSSEQESAQQSNDIHDPDDDSIDGEGPFD